MLTAVTEPQKAKSHAFKVKWNHLNGVAPAVVLHTCFIFLLIEATTQPHILLLLVDDLGWSAVGCHESKICTPNYVDKQASEGVILDKYYVQPFFL